MLSHSCISISETLNSPVDDPWEDTKPTSPQTSWHLQSDPYPLLPPTHNLDVLLRPLEFPERLQLKGAKINALDVLLQDGLKLRVYTKGKRNAQFKKALMLLVWSQTLGQAALI